MKIQILGAGCDKCKTLTKNVKTVVAELRIAATIEKIEDFQKIAEFGVISTPALVIDGKVKSVGKVLTTSEVKALFN